MTLWYPFFCYRSKSCRSLIVEVHRAGMNTLKDSQHFRVRACSDEETATRTIGLNELAMAGIDLQDREPSIRTRHFRTSLSKQMTVVLMLGGAHQAPTKSVKSCDLTCAVFA